VSYAQIGLKLQSRRKKLILTTKPALFIQMDIVCVNGRFNMRAAYEANTQFTIFDLPKLKKQCLIFFNRKIFKLPSKIFIEIFAGNH
jgi:hypothetical protein